MSQSLSLKLSDEAYAALLRQAEASGTSPARLAAASLEQRFGISSQPSDTLAKQARERFEQHFGEISGRASGANNDDIDRDLGREYADTHEED